MKLLLVLMLGLTVSLCSTTAGAFTLSFEEIPAGGDMSYYSDAYGADFGSAFGVADHSGYTGLGKPHSGNNVLAWNSQHATYTTINFGPSTEYLKLNYYSISGFSAYVSITPGVVIEMFTILNDGTRISATLNGSSALWDNAYVELPIPVGSSADGVGFISIGAEKPYLRFCIDDMNVTPVPEPASLVGLMVGVIGLGVTLRRRK